MLRILDNRAGPRTSDRTMSARGAATPIVGPSAGMLVVLGLFAALTVGGLLLLLAAPGPAVATGLVLLLAGVVAQRSEAAARRGIGMLLLVSVLGAGAYGSLLAIELAVALTASDGEGDPADADSLARAEEKIDRLDADSSFRLELTEAELQAVVQDGIAAEPDIPIRRLELDLRGATREVAFVAHFKSGDVTATGRARISAAAGGIDLDLGPVDLGSVQVPGVASGAVESLLDAVTDLNAALAEQRASVQDLQVHDDRVIVTGTRATMEVLTNEALLGAIRAQAAGALDGVTAPPERLGPGDVDALEAPGSPMVLALGDSLAANVGVEAPRDGYVSRFHAAVQRRDDASYGLLNLAVGGETSGTLLSSGQIAAAEAALLTRPAAYVTLDIGANDLLGHLDSTDCAQDLRASACRARVDTSLTAFADNIAVILDRLAAATEAPVVVLQVYDPFSLGLAPSEQEATSSAYVQMLNGVLADAAHSRGMLVADGFTPLQGTAAATTHMLDPDPDVHPNSSGHDALAAALLDAVSSGR